MKKIDFGESVAINLLQLGAAIAKSAATLREDAKIIVAEANRSRLISASSTTDSFSPCPAPLTISRFIFHCDGSSAATCETLHVINLGGS